MSLFTLLGATPHAAISSKPQVVFHITKLYSSPGATIRTRRTTTTTTMGDLWAVSRCSMCVRVSCECDKWFGASHTLPKRTRPTERGSDIRSMYSDAEESASQIYFSSAVTRRSYFDTRRLRCGRPWLNPLSLAERQEVGERMWGGRQESDMMRAVLGRPLSGHWTDPGRYIQLDTAAKSQIVCFGMACMG